MDILWIIVIILVVLWAVGYFTIGSNLLHILLAIALIVLIVKLVRGRGV